MNKVIVDEELKARLHNLDEWVELCDETGRPLGQFVPQAQFQRIPMEWAILKLAMKKFNVGCRNQAGNRWLKSGRNLRPRREIHCGLAAQRETGTR